MTLTAFLASTAAISLSGVLAPGPITAVTLGEGNRSPWAGSLVALGHGAVELPLMIAVAAGLGYLVTYPLVKPAVLILGGAILFMMALGMLRNARQDNSEINRKKGRPFLSGLLLSAGNPYFLIWWGTVGASLLISARQFGIKGIILFGTVHWLCDLFWLTALSWFSSRGSLFFGDRFQQWVFLICGIFLFVFGGFFIGSGMLEVF